MGSSLLYISIAYYLQKKRRGGGGGGPDSMYTCVRTQQTRHVFSPVQHVLIWLKTGANNIFDFFSVFFNRQLLLVIFNIYIIFFVISILDITNYLCLGDINVL